MGTKQHPGLYDCAANADPEEPVFVLRGQDQWGGPLVHLWADLAALGALPADERPAAVEALVLKLTAAVVEKVQLPDIGPCRPDKVDEARWCADQMEAWATKKFPD